MLNETERPRIVRSQQRHLHAANRSPKTIRTYLDAVRASPSRSALSTNRPTDPMDMRRSDIEAFTGHLLDARSRRPLRHATRGPQ